MLPLFCAGRLPATSLLLGPAYSYLLGMYLGDGYLAQLHRGVYSFRVFLDSAYPVIAQECEAAMSLVLPSSRAAIRPVPNTNMLVVCSYGKHWPCLFPQHGPGLKHHRSITLERWQRAIVDRYPWRFLRGLIHSDGCRVRNPAVHPHKTYWYTRYQFSNRSDDIRVLFAAYCAKVGVECRPSNRWEVSVSRRVSVALMDRHIGAKR